jgi:hypothetical protein
LLVESDLEAGTFGAAVKLAGDMQMNGRGFGVGPQGSLYGDFAGTLDQIDPTSGTLLHPVALELGTRAEAVESCGGELYMASRESGSPKGEKLYRIDPATGRASLVGPIGSTAIDIDTLACALDGSLYGVDSDPALGRTIFQIDPHSGSRTALVEIPVAGTINGLHLTAPTPRGTNKVWRNNRGSRPSPARRTPSPTWPCWSNRHGPATRRS